MADIPKPDLPENGGTSVPTNEPSIKAQSPPDKPTTPPPDKKLDPPVADGADRSAPGQKPRVVGVDFSSGKQPRIENGANSPGPPGKADHDLKEPGRDQKAGPEAVKGPASLPVRDKVPKESDPQKKSAGRPRKDAVPSQPGSSSGQKKSADLKDDPKQTRIARTTTSKPKEAPAPKMEPPPVSREAPRPGEEEKIQYINIAELHPFKDHPFAVRDDNEMRSLVESVKDNGVHSPALVRPRPDGGYELIAGHRRQRASEIAGFKDMPCIVRNMTDDEAILAMTDDNLRQRSDILPSERAVSLKMQVEAIKHQGTRTSGQVVQKSDVAKWSIEQVGQRNNINSKQVQRYIRLTELAPDLLKAVDEKKIKFIPAVELSFISKRNQNYIAVSAESEEKYPTLDQAKKMKELDQKKLLNNDTIDGILSNETKEAVKVILSGAELTKYFGEDKTPREMKDQIMKLLDEWKEKQPALETPQKKADLEK